MVSENIEKPVIQYNKDGTVSVIYDPKSDGTHEVELKYNGEPVQGSSLAVHVDSTTSGNLAAYGPGLVQGVAGGQCKFTISTVGAKLSDLKLSVEGPKGKINVTTTDNKDGTVSAQYLPIAVGEHFIGICFGNKHIQGSPFVANIIQRKRNSIALGACPDVSIPSEIPDNLQTLNASILTPSGLEEPCFLKRTTTGTVAISYTPRENGEHVASIKLLGKHVANSPFRFNVSKADVGDSKKVKVTGLNLEAKTYSENVFSVDTRNAGFGGMSVSIEGPSKAEIQCTDNDDGLINMSYKPTEPGFYVINLKFADRHVEGSPFKVKVTGKGSNRSRALVECHLDTAPMAEIGTECKLTFKIPGITSFDLAARVTSPGNVNEDAEVHEVKDGVFSALFTPKEKGVHKIAVFFKDMHIPGSPFQFTAGPLCQLGSHLVKAGGPGLEHGIVGVDSEFSIWAREAGAGSLAISVEGPSKAEIECNDRKDGACDVTYKVTEPGDYHVGLKFNGRHVPDSPFRVYISPDTDEIDYLEVQQFPEGNIQICTPYHFLVRKNGASGEVTAKIVPPSGTASDCFTQSFDSDMTTVRFYPRENGIHAIHVKFNGVHISGSPFRVLVGKEVADPAALTATGKGLEIVKTGQKAEFKIGLDTADAGVGILTCLIDAPSKVAMNCIEVEEGYIVNYTPLLPGDHYVTIKYNNIHIVGSPFKVKCDGDKKADAGAQETSSVVVDTINKMSKGGKHGAMVIPKFNSDVTLVTTDGLGLKKAFVNRQNTFTVHATEAGNNILYVSVYGPKGPCEKVIVKHVESDIYNVNYTVCDRGRYLVLVQWGDDHIPGSPFQVDA